MNIFTVCAFCIVAVCIAALLKQLRPELVPIYTCVVGIIVFGYLVIQIKPIIDFLKNAAAGAGMSGYFELMVKALSIALCCQVCAEICKDCGEASVASKVELAGKISIIAISLPFVGQLLEMANSLI